MAWFWFEVDFVNDSLMTPTDSLIVTENQELLLKPDEPKSEMYCNAMMQLRSSAAAHLGLG